MKLLGGNHTVVFAVLGLALAQGAAAQTVQLSVQPGDGKLLTSKDIQEQFAEHLGRCIYGGFWAEPGLNVPQQGRIRLDIVEALKKIHVPNLRWPGGCFADTYHWHDGVGPTAQRPKMLNLWWGNTLEDNSFGTHEFLELCQLLGTTPYLAANVGSGTVQEMSNWMEYLNSNEDTPMVLERRKNGHPEPYKVSWWGIGKEVQDYYDKGMRVPDDVTLLLCDDNWDNLRKLPKLADKPRRGGYGIYYHFDYVGGPRNYKWLNTNPLPRIWEQMHLAHEYGANQIWIVNVGDLKPMELPISFFLDYAWNPDAIAANQVAAYTRQWAAQQFGPEHAADIADILARYAKYNARRKPELLDANTYSLATGEWATVVADYNALATRAGAINQKLPAAARDAYFELVLHPVLACANLNELYYTVARNHEAAKTGQSTTNALAEQAKVLYARDAEIKNRYHALAGGKWNHMMDQTHIGYTYRQQPDTDKMPEVLTQPAAAPAATPLPVVTETAYVSLEAEHYTKAVNAGFITWQRLPDLGRTAGAVTAFPVTAAPHHGAGRQQSASGEPHHVGPGRPRDGERLPGPHAGLHQHHRPTLRRVHRRGGPAISEPAHRPGPRKRQPVLATDRGREHHPENLAAQRGRCRCAHPQVLARGPRRGSRKTGGEPRPAARHLPRTADEHAEQCRGQEMAASVSARTLGQ